MRVLSLYMAITCHCSILLYIYFFQIYTTAIVAINVVFYLLFSDIILMLMMMIGLVGSRFVYADARSVCAQVQDDCRYSASVSS